MRWNLIKVAAEEGEKYDSDYDEDESDLDDEWMIQHEKDIRDAAKEKVDLYSACAIVSL